LLCFDADFIPLRDSIQRTVGFFRDANVAMVKRRRISSMKMRRGNLGLERALEDEQRLFFRTLQPGRDSMNAIVSRQLLCGAPIALNEIGDVPTETITEDWATRSSCRRPVTHNSPQ
jgi:cellulose synthase (UDP-forming)